MTDASPALDGSAPDVIGAPPATDHAPPPSDSADAGSEREPSSWETEIKSLRAEAKRHRLAQRAAESERDQLRQRVDQNDRREVERLVGDRMQNAADIWLTASIGDLRDEEGTIDAERVAERVDQLLEQRPHWKRTAPADFSSGVRRPIQKPSSIGQAFKNSLLHK